MVATTTEPLSPPDRGIRWFLRNQTSMSRAVLGSGIAVLTFYVVGLIAVLTSHGWSGTCPEGVTRLECSPSDPLAEGLKSDGLGLVATIAVVFALVVIAAAVVSWKRMPNKSAREAVIGGGVLAVQTIILAGFLLWFRDTDVDRFARNFLNISLIGQKAGLVWQTIVDSAGQWGFHFDFTEARPSIGFDGLLLTSVVAGSAGALLVNAIRAIQHGASTLFGRFVLAGVGVGVLQGLVYGVGTGVSDGWGAGLSDLAVRTFIWTAVGLILGFVVVGGRALFSDRRETKPTVLAFVAGAGLGALWVILSLSAAPSFIKGAKNTLVLSGAGATLGFALGLVLALFTMSKRSVVRAPARVYINFFRGTPLIWQISFAGIGFVPALGLNLDMYTIAILVLGLNLAAYSSEVYRAGIQSLERGQIEASRTLGLSYFQSMRYVIVPQAIRRVIPPLLNEFVILIKDTSLVSVLGLTIAQKELLGVSRNFYSSTFDATAWLGAAAGYLIITLPMIWIVTIVEKRLRSGLTSVIG